MSLACVCLSEFAILYICLHEILLRTHIKCATLCTISHAKKKHYEMFGQVDDNTSNVFDADMAAKRADSTI